MYDFDWVDELNDKQKIEGILDWVDDSSDADKFDPSYVERLSYLYFDRQVELTDKQAVALTNIIKKWHIDKEYFV